MTIDKQNALLAINSELIKNGSEFMFNEANPEATVRSAAFVNIPIEKLTIPLETYLKFLVRSSVAFLSAISAEQGHEVKLEDLMAEMSKSSNSEVNTLASKVIGLAEVECHVCLEVYKNYPTRFFIGFPKIDPNFRAVIFHNKLKSEGNFVQPTNEDPSVFLGIKKI